MSNEMKRLARSLAATTHHEGARWDDAMPSSGSEDRDEAIEQLWSELRAAPDIDFRSIAASVFVSSTAVEAGVLARDIREESAAATVNVFRKFTKGHANYFADQWIPLTSMVLGSASAIAAFLWTESSTGPQLWDGLDSYYRREASWALVKIVGVLMGLSLLGLLLLSNLISKYKYTDSWQRLALGVTSDRMTEGKSWGLERFGLLLGGGVAAVMGLWSAQSLWMSVGRIAEAREERAALTRVAVGVMAVTASADNHNLQSLCAIHGIDTLATGIVVRTDACAANRAIYSAQVRRSDSDTALVKRNFNALIEFGQLKPRPIWKVIVEPGKAKLEWALDGQDPIASWTMIVGETLSATKERVTVRDIQGKTRAFVPDASANLPQVGSKVVTEVSDRNDARARFRSLTLF